jgi:hypothetical protein
MGHSWAIQIGPGVTFTPPQRTRRPRRSNSPVQCRPIRHVVCPIPGPHAHAYVRTLTQANVLEPSLLAHDRTSSADRYAMFCVPSQAHTRHAPYVRTLTRTRNTRVGSDTICNTLPTKAALLGPSVGASTHTHSTLLTLSSSLRVKGLTRGWYGQWTKPYKLAPPFFNWQCGTKHAQQCSWATHGPSKLGRV